MLTKKIKKGNDVTSIEMASKVGNQESSPNAKE